MLSPIMAEQSTAPKGPFSLPPDVLEPHGNIIRIIFAEPEQIRLRRVITRSRERKTYSYWTWKLDREAQGESVNEVNGFILLDCDPHVAWFAEQCCEITYIDDSGNETWHYPNILIRLDGKWVFWEIKTKAEAKTVQVSSRTDSMVHGLSAIGFSYELREAEQLARQPRFETADRLRRFGIRPMTFLERVQLQQHLYREGFLTWAMRAPASTEGLAKRFFVGPVALDNRLSLARAPRSGRKRFTCTTAYEADQEFNCYVECFWRDEASKSIWSHASPGGA